MVTQLQLLFSELTGDSFFYPDENKPAESGYTRVTLILYEQLLPLEVRGGLTKRKGMEPAG